MNNPAQWGEAVCPGSLVEVSIYLKYNSHATAAHHRPKSPILSQLPKFVKLCHVDAFFQRPDCVAGEKSSIYLKYNSHATAAHHRPKSPILSQLPKFVKLCHVDAFFQRPDCVAGEKSFGGAHAYLCLLAQRIDKFWHVKSTCVS